jgi:hypothetical protein
LIQFLDIKITLYKIMLNSRAIALILYKSYLTKRCLNHVG